MLINEESFNLLSSGSNKLVEVTCDYCSVLYNTTPKRRLNSNKIVNKDCCIKCKVKKREEISLIKYGVRNPFQRQDVRDKIKTSITQEVKDRRLAKARATNLERYGTAEIFQSKEIQQKIKETNLKKYGSENVSSSEEIKDKRKKTNLERFGHEYYLGSQDRFDKVAEKFGVENVFQLDWVKEKSKKTCLEKYGFEYAIQNKEVKSKAIKTHIKNQKELGLVNCYKDKIVSEWAKDIGYSRSRFAVLVKENGWEKAVSMTPYMSSLESIIESFLREIGVSFEQQVKVDKYFADFVIGDIIIECDGLYWHSETHKKDDYHIKKRMTYIDAGYKPVFFRQDEIINKFHIVKSIILNKLGLSNRIFARKCILAQPTKTEAKRFFEDNHLMGNGSGESFGLYYEGELISCLQLRKKKNITEISRFSNKVGMSVVGGFSRLIKDKPRLFTFIDLRYGSGEYLSEFGFSKKECYPSFKWTNGSSTFHRMKYPSNTGYEHKMYKIWDCGQLRYEQR